MLSSTKDYLSIIIPFLLLLLTYLIRYLNILYGMSFYIVLITMNILVITIIYRRVIYKKPTYNVISTYIPLMIAVTLAPLFFSGIFFGFGKSIYFVEPLAVVAPFILTLTSLSAIEHVKALMLKKWSIVFVILISVIMSFLMIQPIQLATNAGETSILFIRELMMNLTTSIIIILYGLLPALYYRLGVDLIWYYFPIQPMIKTYMSGIMLMIGLIAALVILDYTKFTHSPTLTPKKEIGIISKIKAIAPVLILGIIAISQFAGVHSFVVLTGSMEPEINPGDMVIVKKMEQYSVGDIIAFSTSGTIIVHRIYSFENSRVITKGDANNYADPWRIDQDKIIGKTMFIIPYLGYPLILLSNLFGTYYMGLLFLVSLILLFLFLSYYIKLIRRWYRYEVN